MKVYYKTDGDDKNYPVIVLTENKKVIAWWIYHDDDADKNKHKWDKFSTGAYKTLNQFDQSLKRISKAEVASILFIDKL